MDTGYKEWLEETGLDDTDENKGWYDCPEEDRAGYISDNQDWWENF